MGRAGKETVIPDSRRVARLAERIKWMVTWNVECVDHRGSV